MHVVHVISTFVLCAVLLQSGHTQNEVHTKCQHQATGKPGTCKLVRQCPSAAMELSRHKVPQPCDPLEATVCCVDEDPIDTTIAGGRSLAKCREYAANVFQTKQSPTLVGGRAHYKTRDECGFKSIPLVIGGVKAKRKEFPHMAAIDYDDSSDHQSWQCGGSLISERYVLTAAHCCVRRDGLKARFVRVGDLNLQRDDDDADPQTIAVDDVIVHPSYHPARGYHDIALLRLATPVNITTYVRPICLPSPVKPLNTSTLAMATGWGGTAAQRNGSDDLRKVALGWFSTEDCNASYSQPLKFPEGIVPETQVCAGSKDADALKDTCTGDSGGPLQVHNVNGVYCMYTLVGVTSFGNICEGQPGDWRVGIYTRVAHYVEWIEGVVWPSIVS